MTAALQERIEPVSAFTFPALKVGQHVLWYHGGHRGQKPAPGIVTAVYHNCVDVSLFRPSHEGMFCCSGVRHIDDPTANEKEKFREGAFELGPNDSRLLDLETRLARLEKDLQ